MCRKNSNKFGHLFEGKNPNIVISLLIKLFDYFLNELWCSISLSNKLNDVDESRCKDRLLLLLSLDSYSMPVVIIYVEFD